MNKNVIKKLFHLKHKLKSAKFLRLPVLEIQLNLIVQQNNKRQLKAGLQIPYLVVDPDHKYFDWIRYLVVDPDHKYFDWIRYLVVDPDHKYFDWIRISTK